MDDPVKDIGPAIDACAAAASPDSQIEAFHRYFHPDASFLHPICYVPAGPNSRKTVITIFMFYRVVIPQTHFDINYIAFDERTPGKEGHLFVELVQTPTLRFVTFLTGFRPSLPMHIHFHLVKSSVNENDQSREVWLIDAQEDAIQPFSLMMALPGFRVFGRAFYFLCELSALIIAFIAVSLGVWRPQKHLQKLKQRD